MNYTLVSSASASASSSALGAQPPVSVRLYPSWQSCEVVCNPALHANMNIVSQTAKWTSTGGVYSNAEEVFRCVGIFSPILEEPLRLVVVLHPGHPPGPMEN